MLAGRAEDRLLFDYQARIAALFGYQDGDGKRGIEHFMQKYYRVVMGISELSDLINQHFEEVILRAGESGPATPLKMCIRDRCTGRAKADHRWPDNPGASAG